MFMVGTGASCRDHSSTNWQKLAIAPEISFRQFRRFCQRRPPTKSDLFRQRSTLFAAVTAIVHMLADRAALERDPSGSEVLEVVVQDRHLERKGLAVGIVGAEHAE